MELFRHVRKSVYDPEYYSEVIQKPFSYSIKYFYSLVLVLAVVMSTIYGFIFIPVTVSFLRSFGTQMLNYYPQDLVVTIKGGHVSTNVEEPYRLPLPVELRAPEHSGIDNLLVIDTTNNFSMDLWNEYKTAAWLTKDSLVYRDNKDLRITPLDKAPDTEINKAKLSSWLETISPFFKLVPPLLIFGIFIFFIFVLSSYLVYLLFGALFIWAIAKIKHIPLGYKKSYQVGIHAMTLGILLSLAKLAILHGLPHISFLFTLIMCAVVWINLKKSPEPITIEPLPKE